MAKQRDDIRNGYGTLIVGANTITNDNPTLLNSNKSNIRIIIDKYGDLNKDSKIFSIEPQKTFLILLIDNVEYEESLKKLGVNIVKLKKCSFEEIINNIKKIAIGNILVEGGAKTIGEFLNYKFIDNIIIIQFPIILPSDSVSLCDCVKEFKLLKLKTSYVFDSNYVYSHYQVVK